MIRFTAIGACLCLLLAAPRVYAQEGLFCEAPLIGSLSGNSEALAFGDPNDKTVDALMKLDLPAGVDVEIKT